jgi:hypothetical protein
MQIDGKHNFYFNINLFHKGEDVCLKLKFTTNILILTMVLLAYLPVSINIYFLNYLMFCYKLFKNLS